MRRETDDRGLNKGALIVALPHGVTIRDPAPGNREYVLRNLRTGDQLESDAAERDGLTETGVRKEAYIWVGDSIVARWTSVVLQGTAELSDVRSWGFETTWDADMLWRTFARMSRPVFRELWKLEDSWVTAIYVCTLESYVRSLKWQDVCFKSESVGMAIIGGANHIVNRISRR